MWGRGPSEHDRLIAHYKTALMDAQDTIKRLHEDHSRILNILLAITSPVGLRELNRYEQPAPVPASRPAYPRRPDFRPAVPETLHEQLRAEAEAFRKRVEGPRGESPAKVAADLLSTQAKEPS
jgi:hypothetical protein